MHKRRIWIGRQPRTASRKIEESAPRGRVLATAARNPSRASVLSDVKSGRSGGRVETATQQPALVLLNRVRIPIFPLDRYGRPEKPLPFSGVVHQSRIVHVRRSFICVVGVR